MTEATCPGCHTSVQQAIDVDTGELVLVSPTLDWHVGQVQQVEPQETDSYRCLRVRIHPDGRSIPGGSMQAIHQCDKGGPDWQVRQRGVLVEITPCAAGGV